MYRRQVLATGALTLAVTSGCLLNDPAPETEGSDDDPIEVDDPETLLLTVEQVEDVVGDAWSLGQHLEDGTVTYDGATVARAIMPFDGEELELERGRVLNGVWFHDDVETARDAYEDHPDYQPWFESEGIIDVDIGVESVARVVPASSNRGRWGIVVFRDANVVGAVSRSNSNLDDEELALAASDLAAEMHGDWRE